ncbi:hypothetical protein U9M48_013619 [Paspalum notatum var. saurae]|uniref:DUF4218 domain-containing protein n=1 Tax=Paspalum notatum var. saurae TaxID=547442 RepID=A0AAQ3T116_PASNO
MYCNHIHALEMMCHSTINLIRNWKQSHAMTAIMLINFVYILCFGLNYMYLFDLKSQVRNKARPEGCIAESVLAKEAMALCSGFLEGFEALHSRLSQNDDDDESFVRKAKKLCYKRAHAEEIATKHNRHRINHREVEKFQNDKFHEWFRVHMLQLERENSIRGVNNDKIRWLARGPVEAAKRYPLIEACKGIGSNSLYLAHT